MDKRKLAMEIIENHSALKKVAVEDLFDIDEKKLREYIAEKQKTTNPYIIDLYVAKFKKASFEEAIKEGFSDMEILIKKKAIKPKPFANIVKEIFYDD